jgi:hypothetical protein
MASDSWDDRGNGQAPVSPRSNYVPKVPLFPQNLDDLMQRAGPYADAVKAEVEWSAVTVWFMKDADKALASAFIPIEAASLTIVLVREAVLKETGWPSLGSGLVDHSQKMTVAARAMAEKKAVGQRS